MATKKSSRPKEAAPKAGRSVKTVPVRPAEPEPAEVVTRVRQCVEQIRSLILSGEFLPGQALRQSALAERLGTSRIPVREALTMLQTEGIVKYTPHVGHTVARLTTQQLAEIYTMRKMIETETLRVIDLSAIDVDHLQELNEAIEAASNNLDVERVTQLNIGFHFELFAYSGRSVMLAELRRLWNMSGFYRSVQVYDVQHRIEIITEHQRMIEAIRRRDTDLLIAAMDTHRAWRLPANVYPLGRDEAS
jgi:DNA-binding GntR family transcriptional regulator